MQSADSGVIELSSTRRERVPAKAARLAVIGTPGTGSTWIRSVLADSLAAEELPVDHPADLDWAGLPDRFVVQLSWPRSRFLERALRERGIAIVSVARHPLDVLTRLAQSGPGEASFVEWAVSERAGVLLSLTPQWWSTPATHRVRYEDLLPDADAGFAALLSRLELVPPRVAVHAPSADRGWRETLTAAQVDALMDAHRDLIVSLGYDPDDRELTKG